MNSNLADWIFHYNVYKGLWQAATRSNYHQLFNGGEDILASSSIETLVELIRRTNGQEELLKNIINI